jgi:hypothetical protein
MYSYDHILIKDIDGASELRDGLTSLLVAGGGGGGNEASPRKGSENRSSLYSIESRDVGVEVGVRRSYQKSGGGVWGVGLRCPAN